MPTTYELTVTNNSELTSPKFAVFAKLPTSSSYETLHLAWLIQQINEANSYTFTWDISWGLAWASHGAAAGYQWQGGGRLPADPNSSSESLAEFAYNGDFQLTPSVGPADGQTLKVVDHPTVPLPSDKPSSVAVTLDGSEVCATNAGPNLTHTFTLHPTYYIDAGDYTKGQMVDSATVSSFQTLEYSGGNTTLAVTFNRDNTWTVKAPD